jgi:hypothetical protein
MLTHRDSEANWCRPAFDESETQHFSTGDEREEMKLRAARELQLIKLTADSVFAEKGEEN